MATGRGSPARTSGTLTLSDFDITVTGGTALSLTTSGTVTATGADNDLNATNTALNVNAVTIGAGGLTFRSISASGGANGIVLNTTGPSGGLSITGLGTTDGSGGTIQNITSRGAEFVTTKGLSLKNMNFTNANTSDAGGAGTCDDTNTTNCNAAIYLNGVTTATFDNVNLSGTIVKNGINGINVTDLSLNNSTIANAGTNGGGSDLPADEGAVIMRASHRYSDTKQRRLLVLRWSDRRDQKHLRCADP